MRSDRRRNRDAIIAAAAEAFRTDGPDASLEEVARRAGVGSATLHRHFNGRGPLLAAVYRNEVDRLAQSATDAADAGDSGLWTWLDAVVRHCAADRALLAALDPEVNVPDSTSWEPLYVAARPLADRARKDGALRNDVSVDDLLRLVDSVARATAGDPNAAAALFSVIRRGSRPA